MGQLPKLNNVSPLRKSYQVAFGGLNHNIGASDGEIYDMKNMSADHYPVLTQREKRRLIHTLEAKDGAVYAYGGCIIYIDNDELLRVIYPWYVDSAAGYPGMTACAVEAGEKLGFLPGDLQSKVDPYLRPLYDALFELLGAENYNRQLERAAITATAGFAPMFGEAVCALEV